MAKNRIVNTRFWSDQWVRQKLNPLDRYLFLYFLTNEHTNICGIYELTVETISFETGIDKQDLLKSMFPRLKPKVVYKSGWIIMPNFVKHQNQNSPTIKAGIEAELKKCPDEIIRVAIDYGYPIQALSHFNFNSNSNLNPNPNKSADTPKEKRKDQIIVDYLFFLKGWNLKDSSPERKRPYQGYLRAASELIGLCEDDVEEAKQCLKKVADWAISRELDWGIETVFKKWYDLDVLKPKEKKQYYQGNRVFEMGGAKYVLMPNGEKLKFAGKLSELTYK